MGYGKPLYEIPTDKLLEELEKRNHNLPLKGLNLYELSISNKKRCEEIFHPIDDWSVSDWAVAMAGECGEACNAIKKLRRFYDKTNTAKDPQTEEECIEDIGYELADMIIYADLLASRLGIDLSQVIRDKFNSVSQLRGSKFRL